MEKKLNKRRVAMAAILAGMVLIIGLSSLVSYLLINRRPFDAEKFIATLNDQQYLAAYNMLSDLSKQDYSRQEFTDFYQENLSTLRVEDMRIDNIHSFDRGANKYVSCTLTYPSSHFGDIQETLEWSLTQDGSKLNWKPSCFLNEMSPGDAVKVTTTLGKRGEIFAADGTLLVGNSFAVTVYGEPTKITDQAAFAAALASLIQMTPEEIVEILRSPQTERDQLAIFKSYLPKEFDHNNAQAIYDIPGANIDTERLTPIRSFAESGSGLNLAHVLGYTAVVTQEDLESNPKLAQGALVGREGIEKFYDEKLQPQTGYQVFISGADLRVKKVLYSIQAQNGYDVHLTINPHLQKQVEASMALNMLKDQKGCVLVLDSKTGNVEAMASYPTFDPNLFLKPISQEAWAQLNDEKGGQPLFNRAIYGQYPPGSAIKPFTFAIAMENGILNQSYVFQGNVEDNNWKPDYVSNWVWPPITRYRNYHAAMNLTNSMMYSDNIYFADVALKTGQELFVAGMARFGFTESVPFQLPVSASRLINEKTEWNPKLLADTGYGQGEFLTTPLQLATGYTAFQNGGNILQPNLVLALFQADKKSYTPVERSEVKIWKEKVMNENSIKVLEETLRQTTLAGTGQGVHVPELPLYGKTGTAEVGPNKETEISWYVGYTKNPDKIILAMIECNPKEGSAIKNHIVKDTLYGILGKPLQSKINEIPKESSE